MLYFRRRARKVGKRHDNGGKWQLASDNFEHVLFNVSLSLVRRFPRVWPAILQDTAVRAPSVAKQHDCRRFHWLHLRRLLSIVLFLFFPPYIFVTVGIKIPSFTVVCFGVYEVFVYCR